MDVIAIVAFVVLVWWWRRLRRARPGESAKGWPNSEPGRGPHPDDYEYWRRYYAEHKGVSGAARRQNRIVAKRRKATKQSSAFAGLALSAMARCVRLLHRQD